MVFLLFVNRAHSIQLKGLGLRKAAKKLVLQNFCPPTVYTSCKYVICTIRHRMPHADGDNLVDDFGSIVDLRPMKRL